MSSLFIINFLFFFLGASLGSFLGVTVSRFKARGSWKNSRRSHCDACHKELSFIDLIPVISYIVAGGKCRYCHKKIPGSYFMIEIVGGLLFVLLLQAIWLGWVSHPFFSDASGFAFIFVLFAYMSLFFLISLFDVYHMWIPKSLVFVFVIVSALALENVFEPDFLINKFLGALLGLLLFSLQFFFTGKQGLGPGDVFLALGMGLFLGWKLMILAIILGHIAALLFYLPPVLMTRGFSLKRKIPLAPFFMIGTLLSILLRNNLLSFFEKSILNVF